jgi:hypothetical protein
MLNSEALAQVHEHLGAAVIALTDANGRDSGPWPNELLAVARLLTEAQQRLSAFSRDNPPLATHVQ